MRKLEITPTRIGPKGDRHERAAYRHFMLWFRNTRWILRLNLNLELFRIDTTALPEETVDDFEQNFEIDRMMILILWELGLKSTKTDIVGEWKVGSVAGQRIRPT